MLDEAELNNRGAGLMDPGTSAGGDDLADWQTADRMLRRLASRRAALDEAEARWLLIARRAQVHRHRGFATFFEYVERVLGHAPHAARERMRVAEALMMLPVTRTALAAGRLGYSAVRELTRVATPETEVAWLGAAADRTVREVEAAVAGRRPGDTPDTPPDPALIMRTLRLELSPSTYALFVAARRALEDVCGQALTDDDVVASLCRTTLAGATPSGAPEAASGDGGQDARRANQPPHQIAITTCPDCARSWQDAAGRTVEIGPAEVEMARCDATLLGRVDGGPPAPATRTIPPATRRAVIRRDRGRCVVPGCRGSRFIDVHHLVPRAGGGDHHPSRLAVLCASHHRAVHEGRVRLEGTAPHDLRFFHADGRPYGACPEAPAGGGDPAASARQALRDLGLSDAIAKDAVTQAMSRVGRSAPLAAVIEAALRVCPRPRSASAA